MATEKLLAEWFWADRWMGSSGFLLPMEPRGVYREMLTQAWRRGAKLPNDHAQIRRAIGASVGEWRRCWPKVKPFWMLKDGALVNETQVAIYADALKKSLAAKTKAKKGAAARWGNAQALPEECPPSPSPSLRRTNTKPPNPLSAKGGGLRIRRKDRERAEKFLKLNFGRCPHESPCADGDDCAAVLAAGYAKARQGAEQKALAS